MKQRSIMTMESPLTQKNTKTDILPVLGVFVILVLILIAFGVLQIYSVTYPYSKAKYIIMQLEWVGIGSFAGAAILFFGAKRISDWSVPIVLGIVLALILALFYPEVNGARRWIRIGSNTIQPSEFAKVGLTLLCAKYLALNSHMLQRNGFWNTIRAIFIPGAFACIAIALVFIGKDLGTTILLCLLCAILFYTAGLSPILPLSLFIIAAGIGIPYIKAHDAMRWNRLTVFMNPEPVADGAGFQIWRSLLALGSGDWIGNGFGSSILKMKYLPEDHTDFILAIAGEELGFITILSVIVVYLVLALLGIVISTKARTRQNKFIAFGMITFIALQALINIGVICAAFPTKGMPAPFISYGGSNMVACIMAVACIISVALDTAYPDYADRNMDKLKSFLHLPLRKTRTAE